MSATKPQHCAWMSVTSHGESVPMKWHDAFEWNKNAYAVEDAPNLEEWRKEMAAKGTPDPFHMLTAEERNAWVDDADNRHFNPTLTTPSGFRYNPKYPYYGAYGRYNMRHWPRMHASLPGFTVSIRTALTCHPEILKRESIGLLWVMAVAIMYNKFWWDWSRAADANKDYWLAQQASDTPIGTNFGRKVSMTE